MRRGPLLVAVLLSGAACAGAACAGDATTPSVTASSSTSGARVVSSPSAAPTVALTTTSTIQRPETIVVAYRVERHTSDDSTANFVDVVDATLGDDRGWERSAFRFVHAADAPYLIVLAEGEEVDRLCLPYDTYGRYSCQNGPVVAINADRWRSADPKWTGDLPTYRQMLVNHEVGHLLGQKHPRPQCPRQGEPAPVMNQQSTELNGCLPNPWPLEWEIRLAARHDRPLAPPPD